MPLVGVWNIHSGKPTQLNRNLISLETHLEDWIEQDPSLVNPDLLVVGRQMMVEAGKLDLLAVDRLGNYWAVIEIKKGNVRRDTISQAVDYAACIDEMSAAELRQRVERYLNDRQRSLQQLLRDNELDETIFDHENRNLVIYVVGTGRDPNLERMARFLTNAGSQINIVTFDTFEDADQNWTIVRQLEELESDTRPIPKTQPKQASAAENEIDRLMELANQIGIREPFKLIYDVATKHGLFPRAYSQSIMYAPVDDKRRFLIYTPLTRKKGKYIFHYSPEAFAEFFPISLPRTYLVLGMSGVQTATVENARKFAKNLDELFKIIDANR